MFTNFARRRPMLVLIVVGAVAACCITLARAQQRELAKEGYTPYRAAGVALVGYSELLFHKRELDGQEVEISGYCARLSGGDGRIFLFPGKEAADHLQMRDSFALRYDQGNTRVGVMKEADFNAAEKKLNNRYCTARGRYSVNPVFVLGSDVDKGIPSEGTVFVNFLSGGMAREGAN